MMTTNNDTAAILAALDAAGLEIPELEWTCDFKKLWGHANNAFSLTHRYQIWRNKINAVKSGITLVITNKNAYAHDEPIVFDRISVIEAIAAANAHNRELVAGMLRVKEAK